MCYSKAIRAILPHLPQTSESCKFARNSGAANAASALKQRPGSKHFLPQCAMRKGWSWTWSWAGLGVRCPQGPIIAAGWHLTLIIEGAFLILARFDVTNLLLFFAFLVSAVAFEQRNIVYHHPWRGFTIPGSVQGTTGRGPQGSGLVTRWG